MAASIILTLIGKDRPGLVSAVSERIAAFEGNWLDSRMAHLAGQFAGILLVELPEAKVAGLTAALKELEGQGLRVAVEPGFAEAGGKAVAELRLELMGHDHPGIVRDVAQALSAQGVNIEELSTEVVSGSMSGSSLFRASARLRAPGNARLDELREILERLAGDLMVEITLDAASGAARPAGKTLA